MLVTVDEGSRRLTHPYLVQAQNCADARLQGLQLGDALIKYAAHVEVDVHVLSEFAFRDVVPDVKAVARAYWLAGCDNKGDDKAEFFELWD